jgi:hypothetical protein
MKRIHGPVFLGRERGSSSEAQQKKPKQWIQRTQGWMAAGSPDAVAECMDRCGGLVWFLVRAALAHALAATATENGRQWRGHGSREMRA